MYTGFLFNKLSCMLTNELEQSFEELNPDIIDYNDSDFTSRYRHFSAFNCNDNTINKLKYNANLFNNVKSFHARTYANRLLKPISCKIIPFIQEILLNIFNVIPVDANKYAIGINQIRVICSEIHAGATAPTFHQDGYDYSCHICINRMNINGGESIISADKNGNSIKVKHTLQPSEYIFFDDRAFFHTATPITTCNLGNKSFRDMIIIDFLRLNA